MALAARDRLLRLTRDRVRNADFPDLQESFLVAAIATILVIRTQLWATNYPQLGGHGLHIAHLLYGGLLMAIAIAILITYLGRSLRRPAAIVGGVGFGFFIDELGKFVTADNNYFYKPAAALIYLIFVALFLASRAMQRRRGLSSTEYVVNAIDLVGEAARHALDEHDRRRALELLSRADPGDPLVAPVRRLLEEVETVPPPEPALATRWARAARDRYVRLISRPWFPKALAAVFAVWAISSILATFELVLSLAFELGGARPGDRSDALADLSLVNAATLVSSLVSGILVGIGLYRLRKGMRLAAYRMFDHALLVSIFVTQVFSFVESQFGAVFGLALNVLLLVTLRYVTGREQEAARSAESGRSLERGSEWPSLRQPAPFAAPPKA